MFRTSANGTRMAAVFLFLFLLFGAFSGDARAALGVHDVGGAEGSCASCHNNAQAAAQRGWGRSFAGLPAGGWYTQPITALCWTCHSALNTVGAHDVTGYAMNASNHYYVVAQAPPGARDATVRDNASVISSNLPYATTGALQCTSCHNVHNGQYRPFMAKPTIRQLCDSCHPRRNTAALGAANIGVGGDGVSVHPVNVPMTDNLANGASGIKTEALMDANMKNNGNPAPASNGWVLGGKLSGFNTGNVTCETCHAVHGSPAGAGILDLLAVENQPDNVSAGSNPLCEGCHYGGRASGAVGGSGTADHPLDNVRGKAFYPTGVAIPVDWKNTGAGGNRLDRGASVFTTASPATATESNTRCSSCHDAHGGVGATSLLRSPVPLAASGEWCYSCHLATQVAPTAHHSAKGLEGGRFVSSVTCAMCHGSGSGGGFVGHNGFLASYATPPAQFTTARNRVVAVNDVKSNLDSALCLYCHRDDDPVAWRGAYGYTDCTVMTPYVRPISTSTFPRFYGTWRGFDSHSLAADGGNAPGTVLKADTWVAGRSIFSKYGATSGGGSVAPVVTAASTVICESCHNVLLNDGAVNTASYGSPAEAGWESNLLLLPYKDDFSGTGPGAGGEGNVGSAMCTGCHLEGAGSHHPLTGETVYRTGAVLATGPASLADQPGAPGTLSYPAANRMDCDSCHRPHSANDNSTVLGAAGRADNRFHFILEVDGTGNNWSSTLCTVCHAN